MMIRYYCVSKDKEIPTVSGGFQNFIGFFTVKETLHNPRYGEI